VLTDRAHRATRDGASTCCHRGKYEQWSLATCTWHVQNVFDVWPGKIYLHAWRSATLILFEVVFLWLKALLSAVPPFFETFMECLFANGVQLGHLPYNVVSWLKSNPFQLRLQVGGTVKNRKEPFQKSREPAEPQECCVWPRKFESVARN